MKTSAIILLGTVILIPFAPMAHAAAPKPPAGSAVQLQGTETPAQMQEAFAKAISDALPGLDKGDANALKTLEATVHQSARPGAEAERAACSRALAAALTSDAKAETKTWLVKQMQNMGGLEAIPALAKLLADKDGWLRETARCALQNNPVPEAAAALRTALNQTTEPAWQAALALALGARKDAGSVTAIAALLKSRDEQLQAAAFKALGDIAVPQAAQAIETARKSVPASLRVISGEAWMKCAEQMLRAGSAANAQAVYARLNVAAEPRPVRLAALRGTLQCAGDAAGNLILTLLSGTDVDARQIATAQINHLGSGAAKNLVSGAGKLPIESQMLIVGLLASRGEKAALPLALELARGQNESARAAGIGALARLGDATTVPFLVENLAAAGEAGAEARASLTRLAGPGVNEKILDAMKQAADAKQKTTLIEILEARGATIATPALLALATGDNAALRRAAMKALGKLALPASIPDMIKGLFKTEKGGERNDAEKAIALVCARTPEKERQADPVLAAHVTATPAEKALLVPLLGRIGGNKAFEVIKAALASTDNATVEAGQTALYNWPDATEDVADQLLVMVTKAQKPAEKQTALRAYIRVVSLPDGLPDKLRFERLQKALPLADRPQEKNFVLECLQEVKRIESVRLAVTCLDDPALSARAGTTIVELAKDRGLKDRNKADFEQALNKIIATSKDPALIERAKRRIAEK